MIKPPVSQMPGITFPAIPDQVSGLQLAIQYQLEHSQWWPVAQIKTVQRTQLLALLRFASQNIPFYQRLFGSSEKNIPEPLTTDFIDSLPILTRGIVQQEKNQMFSKVSIKSHGEISYSVSSGSTGTPVTFARTQLTQTLWRSFALREHLWNKRDFSGKLGAIRWFAKGVAEPPHGASNRSWGHIVSPVFESGISVSLNVTAPLESQKAWLDEQKLDYLISFPSNLMALTRYIIDKDLCFPSIRELRTIGELLTDEMRVLLETSWGCKVTDIYSCEEAGYIAIQCPEAHSYHVQSENILLEIVDDDGEPCPIGVPGRVLVTTLHNYASPLIRYELGDIAEYGEPCSCGRGLPVIKKILGRKRNRLTLPSGESRFPYLGEHGGIAKLTGVKVKQFQCVQIDRKTIEIRLSTAREFSKAEELRVSELVQKNLGYPFNVRFKFFDEIPKSSRGKFEEFISLVEM